MARYKKLKVGDTVFAIDAHNEVIMAKIKAIKEGDDWLPYELDLDTKLRYYDRPNLYTTPAAAEKALFKKQVKERKEALESGRPISQCTECDYDKKTHTFIGNNGARISEYFECEPEVMDGYSKLVSKLAAYCGEHDIPMIAIGCMMHKKGNKYAFLASSILPGPRTPDILYDVDDMFRDMDEDDWE